MNIDKDNKFTDFLNDIAPYVVVVGSFARNQEKETSDIDCFLRSRPIEEVNPEIDNETYMPEILDIIERHGLSSCCDSVIVGHIAIERSSGFSRMIEIASHYRIPITSELFYREIEGVPMLCAADNKETELENCYDDAEWDDNIGDMAIKNPLPIYNPEDFYLNRKKLWYDDQVKAKENKVVVKLKNADGSFKGSCIMPTVMYPLNEKYRVFTSDNTYIVADKRILDTFDRVKYQIGHCYQNTANLVQLLRDEGIDAQSYVGWLFTSGVTYPIHHCWAVVDDCVLDLADDFSVMFNEHNAKNFTGLTIEEQRKALADFHREASKYPNSLRCAPVGRVSRPLFYVGCECDPEYGRKIYRDLIKAYPDHPVHKNVGSDGLNATQNVLKSAGLM